MVKTSLRNAKWNPPLTETEESRKRRGEARRIRNYSRASRCGILTCALCKNTIKYGEQYQNARRGHTWSYAHPDCVEKMKKELD